MSIELFFAVASFTVAVYALGYMWVYLTKIRNDRHPPKMRGHFLTNHFRG
ncbi:MAG: hypothetical protein IJS96_03100 [Schwartzia sp.]|nr:hypothetical protein [Schwartzia sp. (in: firmicutes)]